MAIISRSLNIGIEQISKNTYLKENGTNPETGNACGAIELAALPVSIVIISR